MSARKLVNGKTSCTVAITSIIKYMVKTTTGLQNQQEWGKNIKFTFKIIYLPVIKDKTNVRKLVKPNSLGHNYTVRLHLFG